MPKPEDVIWIDDDTIIRETDLAICVLNDEDKEVWLPKSQLSFYDDGRISIPMWLARQRKIS